MYAIQSSCMEDFFSYIPRSSNALWEGTPPQVNVNVHLQEIEHHLCSMYFCLCECGSPFPSRWKKNLLTSQPLYVKGLALQHTVSHLPVAAILQVGCSLQQKPRGEFRQAYLSTRFKRKKKNNQNQTKTKNSILFIECISSPSSASDWAPEAASRCMWTSRASTSELSQVMQDALVRSELLSVQHRAV